MLPHEGPISSCHTVEPSTGLNAIRCSGGDVRPGTKSFSEATKWLDTNPTPPLKSPTPAKAGVTGFGATARVHTSDPSPGSRAYSEPSLLPETTSSRVPPRPSSACTTSGPFRKPKSWWAIVWVQGPVTKAQSAELRHSIDPSLAHAPNCSGGSTRVFQTTVPLAASI